jgi:hypothetical protein
MSDDEPKVRDDLGVAVMKVLGGHPIFEGLAALGRVLIHLCLRYGFTRQQMHDALDAQWDSYEPKFREREAEKDQQGKPN